jgi:adenosylcobinamide kinase/adenosylcobinamide-phosphate guanylyltransferase
MILITGGARSGKSRYAQELALQYSGRPIYVATARAWDEEFRKNNVISAGFRWKER